MNSPALQKPMATRNSAQAQTGAIRICNKHAMAAIAAKAVKARMCPTRRMTRPQNTVPLNRPRK